ncbi:hypothetical protein [Prochlorococcus sp. MIT 1223]|uniref:hypothetical protein n=1 Tax=Prochlorococcus sp. MIT 1223 TaxID=3096217 RepID=UPI002A75F9DB|nr:hypothetical protein [Prochlorococcus sp. MIT 1223]
MISNTKINSLIHKKKDSCETKDFLGFLSEVRLDLVDPVNKAAAKRYNNLIALITKLQKIYEGNHLKNK